MEEYFAQVGVYVLPSTDVWYDDTRFLIHRLTAIDAGTDRETVGTRDRFADDSISNDSAWRECRSAS
jgi:hypothetical protein